MEAFFFYLFGIMVVGGAIGTVALASPISSALSLLGCLFSVACLMALLNAHFVAAMQIILYAGAVMVLFVFVIMLINLGPSELARYKKMGFSGIVGLVAGGYLMAFLILRLLSGAVTPAGEISENFGTAREVGRVLFAEYLIPFEMTSFLLLVAIVGTVVMAKRKI